MTVPRFSSSRTSQNPWLHWMRYSFEVVDNADVVFRRRGWRDVGPVLAVLVKSQLFKVGIPQGAA